MKSSFAMIAGGVLFAASAAADEAPITFCLSSHNMPFSAAHPPGGIDVDIARAIADELGRRAQFKWQEPSEAPDLALLNRQCDAAMGAVVDPGEMAQGGSAAGIGLSQPYYAAGYQIVHRTGLKPPTSLDQVKGERIGVEMVSIPIYTLKLRGQKVFALASTEAVLKAVADGRAAYGYLWGPAAGWILRDRDDLKLAGNFAPEDRWNFAIAVRAKDADLLKRLNSGLRELGANGEIASAFEKYGARYMAPVQTGSREQKHRL